MVIPCCPPERKIIHSLKLVDYLHVQTDNTWYNYLLVNWLVGFVALRPKSTAMVIAGRSVHLTTLFPGQA